MSEFGEAIGTAFEGGLFARALEPGSGAASKHPDQPDNCLNCETPLTGAFCHVCGQKAHLHRTISAFWHDLLHGALHLDGKMWRTLPLLALRPGRLTRRYIDGARARFVSPMALFLFSVFLMFAVFQMLGISAPTDIETSPEVQAGIETGIEDAISERDTMSAELAAMSADDPQRGRAERRIAELDAGIAGLQGAQVFALDIDDRTSMSIDPSGVAFIDDRLISKWQNNPGLMIYKMQANSYKFSWLLIPLSIPFVWLLFAWKRRFKAYDHAIFVTYSLSFMTLLFVTLSLLGAAGLEAGWLFAMIVIVAPWHIYRQLRGTYDLSRLSAFWRLLVLLFFILVILLGFLQILLVLGAF